MVDRTLATCENCGQNEFAVDPDPHGVPQLSPGGKSYLANRGQRISIATCMNCGCIRLFLGSSLKTFLEGGDVRSVLDFET